MGDYIHTTRECTLDSMCPDLSAQIHAHVEKYNLGDILSKPVMCIETTSEKKDSSARAGRSTLARF